MDQARILQQNRSVNKCSAHTYPRKKSIEIYFCYLTT